MSVELESAKRLDALKQGIEARTGETYADLTDGVNALIAGYGSGGGGGDPYVLFDSIMRRTIEEFNYTAEVTWPDENLFGYLFNNCDKMKKWAVPNLTWRISAGYMFRRCLATLLTYIDLGKPTGVHNTLFYGFKPNGASIIIRSEAVPQMSGAFSGTGFTDTHFYVRRALVDEFKTATNWSTYADMYRALEDYTVDGTATGELDMSKI
jgi:hypothetical protein